MLKIIISHDVDHIHAWEHTHDLMIPKYLARNIMEIISGKITMKEFYLRHRNLIKNKWNNIEELLNFDLQNSVPSTFFIAVSKGLGLNYSLKESELWIKKILTKKIDIGLHGIAFKNIQDIQSEWIKFKKISKLNEFGMRIHYLRYNNHTLDNLEAIGFTYDSTLYKIQKPRKKVKLWEFPLQIMDICLFEKKNRWQDQTLQQAKDETKRIIDQSIRKEIRYLNILSHDRYFTESYKSWKTWYIWMIDYFKNNSFEFINYRNAIRELEGSY